MTDTIDMAREAGLHLATDVNWMPVIGIDHLKAFEALVRADERKNMQAEKQEPVACAVCTEVHAILDADESKIIRDAKDGYPDGRTPRTLTLQERITALCVYASDWKRWCLEKENTTPPAAQPARKPLTDEQILSLVPGLQDCLCDPWDYNNSGDYYASIPKDMIRLARAIEAAHGIKEKNHE